MTAIVCLMRFGDSSAVTRSPHEVLEQPLHALPLLLQPEELLLV